MLKNADTSEESQVEEGEDGQGKASCSFHLLRFCEPSFANSRDRAGLPVLKNNSLVNFKRQ